VPDLRVNYVQVDSMNKCVPQDWFLGYDQFTVYTFLNLAGQITGKAGFLKSFFRIDHKVFFVNNLSMIDVDFGYDFIGNLGSDTTKFFSLKYLWMRTVQLFITFLGLGMCYVLVHLVSYLAY